MLILEDDEICSTIIARFVKDMGGEALVCPTVATAREAAQQKDFNLLVLDHCLPDGTGSAFFHEMRQHGRLELAIMLTGAPDISIAIDLTRHGLFDYLTKPIQSKPLHDCLQRVMLQCQQPSSDLGPADFITRSTAMKKVRQLIHQAAQNPQTTVLLTGETGTGKDLTARLIHDLTFRHASPVPPLVSLNCPTLPAEMFEAELFGAEKGSYTGAYQQRNGLVETANGGTLFLDEIAEVPISLQSKLLQFLESRVYRRLGSAHAHTFSGRIIAATNRTLQEEVQNGRFRADLLYRLDVFPIHLPPLRERTEDLAGIIKALLDILARKYERPKLLLSPEDAALLEKYSFPGNVRELRNLLERMVLQTPPTATWLELDPWWAEKLRAQPPSAPSAAATCDRDLNPIETQEYGVIRQALSESKGGIRRAAAKLGITHQALLRRLEKWPELRD